jgi:hypothetical protein
MQRSGVKVGVDIDGKASEMMHAWLFGLTYRRTNAGYVSPGHFTSHVVYPLTNQSTSPCIYPASGTPS